MKLLKKVGGALGAIALAVTPVVGLAAFAPLAANAASVCSETDYDCIFEVTNIAGDGVITAETPSPTPLAGQLEVTLRVDIPEGVENGDKMFLAISNPFVVSNFQPKKLTSSDGSVEYATVTRNAVGLEVAFEEGASIHSDAVASITFTVYPAPTEFTNEVYPLTFYAGATQGEAVAKTVNVGPNQDILVKGRAQINNGFSGGAIYPNNELGVMASAIFVVPNNFDPSKLVVKLTPNPIENGFPKPITDLVTYSYVNLRDADGKVLSQSYDLVRSIDGDTVTITLPEGFDATGISSLVITYGFYVDKANTTYTFDPELIYDEKTLVSAVLPLTSGNLGGSGEGTLNPATITTEKVVVGNVEDPVAPGEEVSYQITTTNIETIRNAYNVVTTDTLPAGVTFVSATDGGVYANGVVTWPARTIAAGESVEYGVTVSVDEDTEGQIRNVVSNVGENVCLPDDVKSICKDEEIVEVAPLLLIVDPETPAIVPAPAGSCDIDSTVTIPEVEGVEYEVVTEGKIVTVTAQPLEGYTFSDDAVTSWEFDISPTETCPLEVTPVAPTLVPADKCDIDSTVTIPEVEGVEYQVVTDSKTKVVTVTAVPVEGYVFTDGSVTSWKFDVSPAKACETPQSPEKGTSVAKTGSNGAGWLIGLGAVLLAGGAAAIVGSTKKAKK